MKDKKKECEIVDGVKVYPIPGWEGLYGVTKCGKIWSFPRLLRIRGGGRRMTKGVWKKLHKNKGYWMVSFSRKQSVTTTGVHSILARTFLSPQTSGLDVDHINGRRDDNRLSNLRLCSRSENLHNSRHSNGCVSGYKGVSKHKKSCPNPWYARICVNMKTFYLGCFPTPEEAAKAYDRAAKNFFGEFCYQNFPDE